MGLLDQLFNKFIAPILERIKRALGPFGKLFDLVKKLFTGLKSSFDKGRQLATLIIGEIDQWRNFKEALPVRTGVISLPSAIDKSQELLDEIVAAWHSIVDLFRQIQKQAQGQTEDPTVEAEEALKDIESSGVKGILEKFPKLAKGLEKLLGFLALVIGIVETLESTIDDLDNIVKAIRDIRLEIETGSTIFLSQKNPRRTLKLADGSSIKIRVGNLHS